VRVIYMDMRGMKELRKIRHELADNYIQGISTYKMGKMYNTYPMNITMVLREMNVPSRPANEQRNISIPVGLKEKIDGWLLGDGSAVSVGRQGNFTISSKHESYINYVSKCFDDCGMSSKHYTSEQFNKTYYRLRTVSTVEMGEMRRRWYRDKIKIVPADLHLSNACIRHWIMDDGTLDQKKGHLRMCTNGFTVEECEWLAEQLNEFLGSTDIHACEKGKGTTRVYIPKKEVLKLYSKVGSCDVNCFMYKWNVPSMHSRIGKGSEMYVENYSDW